MDAKSNIKIIPKSLAELIKADTEKYKHISIMPTERCLHYSSNAKYVSTNKKDSD